MPETVERKKNCAIILSLKLLKILTRSIRISIGKRVMPVFPGIDSYGAKNNGEFNASF
jgi:hypothetical protein